MTRTHTDQAPSPTGDPSPSPAEQEVVELCADLLRIDTTNFGGGDARGERPAAEYVAARLAEAGHEPLLLESAPGRASVVARVTGSDPGRPALLVHGHLDVVPADPTEWTVPPFSAEIRDGCIWGRGAIDMKNMDAMVLAVVREWARSGRRPARDIVLAFLADEEDTSAYGSSWLVDTRPELFDGCTEAISESGAFSFPVAEGRRVYPIATGERGSAWMRLTARGAAGHGSKANPDNAVTRLCAALARLGEHQWPVRLTPNVAAMLDGLAAVMGVPGLSRAAGAAEVERLLAALGPAARLAGSTLRSSTNPTMLEAGYKVNVIPGQATGYVDGRTLPGYEDEFLTEVDRLIGPGVTRELVNHAQAVEAPFAGPTVEAMVAALRAEDPDAHVVPYCMSGGTDAKSFARLGIAGFGFTPLLLPVGLDYFAMFHGVDERVPIDGLRFGVRVLDRFLSTC